MNIKARFLIFLAAAAIVFGNQAASKAGSSTSPIQKSYKVVWDVPVTRLDAGAQVPGVPTRYLRLQLHPAGEFPLALKQVEVFVDASKP
jgi:hypothetical protein